MKTKNVGRAGKFKTYLVTSKENGIEKVRTTLGLTRKKELEKEGYTFEEVKQ